MKFRLISKYGDGLMLLHRIQKEGNKVDYWTNGYNPKIRLKRSVSIDAGLDKDTVIIFDTEGFGCIADKLKKAGYRVYGAGGINDALCQKFGQKAAKISGLLTKKPDKGIELSTEGFYIEGELVPNSLSFALEQKRFMDFDKGPLTTGQTAIMKFWPEKEPRIYRMTLKKMAPFLKKFKYSGPLRITCMITGRDDVHFLGWTSKFKWIQALLDGLNMSAGKFVSDLASNQKPVLKPSHDWLGTVVVSVPPYPSGNGETYEVTGRHRNLKGLEKELYTKVDKLKIPDMQYRSDAVSGVQNRIGKLKEWKYL